MVAYNCTHWHTQMCGGCVWFSYIAMHIEKQEKGDFQYYIILSDNIIYFIR